MWRHLYEELFRFYKENEKFVSDNHTHTHTHVHTYTHTVLFIVREEEGRRREVYKSKKKNNKGNIWVYEEEKV